MLVIARPEGLYCPAGDFYIDPWRPVKRAVITHGHSDHARPGHGHHLAHTHSAGILRQRLGASIQLQTLDYGEMVEHHGVRLPPTHRVTELDPSALKRALVIAPPSAQGTPWMRRFGADALDAFASGWMQVRGSRRRRGVDRGIVMSDHTDWPGLMGAIAATGAEHFRVTHGSVPVLVRWLSEQGLDAQAIATAYGDKDVADQAPAEPPGDLAA